jgi:hypothetical protein
MWDVAFEATYEVTLRSGKLMLEFSVRNPGEETRGPPQEEPIEFTAALHTYIEVGLHKLNPVYL